MSESYFTFTLLHLTFYFIFNRLNRYEVHTNSSLYYLTSNGLNNYIQVCGCCVLLLELLVVNHISLLKKRFEPNSQVNKLICHTKKYDIQITKWYINIKSDSGLLNRLAYLANEMPFHPTMCSNNTL